MRSRVTASIAGILAVLAMAAVAAADEFEIDGHHLKIETIDGYCALGHTDPADKLLYGIADEAGRGVVRTLSYQADCAALARFRKDRSLKDDVEPSLLFQITLIEGKETALPITREKFLEIMETVLKSQYGDEVYALAKQGMAAAVARLKEKLGPAMAGVTITDTQMLGIVDRDDLGVYIGIRQSYDNNGAPYVIAGVGATTIINGLPLTVTRTDRYTGPEQFPELTADVQRVLRALVTLNEGSI